MDRNVNDYTFMKLSGKILWLIQLVKNFRDKRLARLHEILPVLGFCFGNAGSWRTLSNLPEKQDLSARCSFLDLTPGHLGRLSEQVPDPNQPAVIAYIFRHFLELFLANKTWCPAAACLLIRRYIAFVRCRLHLQQQFLLQRAWLEFRQCPGRMRARHWRRVSGQ